MNKFIKDNGVLIGIASIVGYGIYKAAQFIKSPAEAGTNLQSVKSHDQIVSSYNADKEVKKALTPDMLQKAERLEVAFTGVGGFGTDEDEVYRVYDSVTTPAQIKALYVAYGQRYISGSFFTAGFAKLDLVSQTRSSLNDKEFARVSNKLKLVGLWS